MANRDDVHVGDVFTTTFINHPQLVLAIHDHGMVVAEIDALPELHCRAMNFGSVGFSEYEPVTQRVSLQTWLYCTRGAKLFDPVDWIGSRVEYRYGYNYHGETRI